MHDIVFAVAADKSLAGKSLEDLVKSTSGGIFNNAAQVFDIIFCCSIDTLELLSQHTAIGHLFSILDSTLLWIRSGIILSSGTVFHRRLPRKHRALSLQPQSTKHGDHLKISRLNSTRLLEGNLGLGGLG